MGNVVVVYDYMVDENDEPAGRSQAPSGPLRNYLGNDFFSDVIRVTFPAGQLPECGLLPLHNIPRLCHLSLRGSKVRDKDVPLDAISGLQSLDAAFTDITDDTANRLTALRSLKKLDLSGTLITDAALKGIRTWSMLENLVLHEVAVSEQAVEQLRKDNPTLEVAWSNAPSRKHLLAMRKLSQLGSDIDFVRPEQATADIDNYFPFGYRVAVIADDRIWNYWENGEADLAALEDLDSVSTLILDRLPLTDDIARMVSKLPKLRSLTLSNVHVLSSLGWFPRLHPNDLLHLSLQKTPLFGRHDFYLSDLPQVESLSLEATGVSDRSLARLVTLRRLRQIDLSSTLITDNGMATLARHENLENVVLNRTAVSDAGVAELAQLKSLRKLGLCMTDISDSALTTLATVKAIEELDLSFTGVTDTGLAKLRGMPRLRKINLSGTFISDKGLEYLAELPSLKQLWLIIDGNRVTKAGVRRLQTTSPELQITLVGPVR
jgi:Leucine-rich repeat (LRR) protein